MSDVVSPDSLGDLNCDPAQDLAHRISILAIVISSFVTMTSVLVWTLISAIRAAKVLASQREDLDEVVILQEHSDLNQPQMTVKSSFGHNHFEQDDLANYYDKIPSNFSQNYDHSDTIRQMPTVLRDSRHHSSIFPSIEESGDMYGHSPALSLRGGSITSLGASFAKPRQNSTASYGMVSRKHNTLNVRRVSSQERVNQLTRYLLLNEDVEIFRDISPSPRRRGSSSDGSSRKLSMDVLSRIAADTYDSSRGTLRKSLTSLSLTAPIPALVLKKKPVEYESQSSVMSAASDATIKAEPIKPTKYIKKSARKALANYVPAPENKYDTLTYYRRQRRTGVHFSQNLEDFFEGATKNSSDV